MENTFGVEIVDTFYNLITHHGNQGLFHYCLCYHISQRPTLHELHNNKQMHLNQIGLVIDISVSVFRTDYALVIVLRLSYAFIQELNYIVMKFDSKELGLLCCFIHKIKITSLKFTKFGW